MTQVSNLTGPALDWAVECALTGTTVDYDTFTMRCAEESYCEQWANAGPIIDRELIDIASKFICATAEHPNGTWGWQATAINEDDKAFWYDGPTPLIAAMRCFVASKLGDTINLPEELQ